MVSYACREMAYDQLCGVIHNHSLQETDCLAQEQKILQLDMMSITISDLEVSMRFVMHVCWS